MAFTITHRFVSVKADSSDASLVNPSNWNDGHDVSGVGTQVVSGSINGINKTFTIAVILSDFMLFRNGQLQLNTVDYTWSTGGGTTTITYIYAPSSDDTLFVWGH